MVTHPFAPVVDENCRTLILGSFPSVKSRENGVYYGHPQNRFWPLMASVLGCAVPQSIEDYCKLSDASAPVYWAFTAQFGRNYAQMCIAWAEDCIKRLEEMV